MRTIAESAVGLSLRLVLSHNGLPVYHPSSACTLQLFVMARRTVCDKPHLCSAGRLLIHVATKCATQHITVSWQASSATLWPALNPAVAALTFPQASVPRQQQKMNQQQQQHSSLQFQMMIECVVVSVWDDERRRLLGGTAGGSPALALAPAPAPAELCCVYWDNLSLEVTRRQQAASTGMPILALPALCFTV